MQKGNLVFLAIRFNSASISIATNQGKQIVQAEGISVVPTGVNGFSQSGPMLARYGAFALLRTRLLPILAGEYHHAEG